MALTVGEALRGPLGHCRLVAGESGLDRAVEAVGVLEAADSVHWVRGGELLLTIGYFLGQDAESSVIGLLQAIAHRRAAALAIKLGRYVGSLGSSVASIADSLSLPLIEVPFESSWHDIIGPLLRHLFDRQADVLNHSRQVNEFLARSQMPEPALQSLPGLLASLVECPVALCDPEGHVLAYHPEPHEGKPAALPPPPEDKCYVRRIRAREQGEVLLVVQKAPHLLAKGDLIAIEHIVTAIVVELLGMAGRLQLERQARFSLVFDLQHGNIHSRDTACARGSRFGCDLRRGGTAIVVSLYHASDTPSNQVGESDDSLELVRKGILTALESLMGSRHPASLVANVSDNFFVVLPAPYSLGQWAQQEAVTVAAQIHEVIADRGGQATVGVGRYYPDAILLSRSFAEAQEAIRLGKIMGRRNAVLSYDQLGVWRVLGPALDHNPDQCSGFVRETLGPLLREGSARRGDLLASLRAFLDSNGNVREVARLLHIHPSTVNYRLGRIRQKYGINWDTPEKWLALQTAMKLYDCLGGLP